MGSSSILDLVMPIIDDAGACKLPCPVSTIAGGGMVSIHSNVCSGLIYTKTCSYDSIVLQAAVTSAARGHKVLIIMGEHRQGLATLYNPDYQDILAGGKDYLQLGTRCHNLSPRLCRESASFTLTVSRWDSMRKIFYDISCSGAS